MSEENYASIQDLYAKIVTLTNRVVKLELIIVELHNCEEKLTEIEDARMLTVEVPESWIDEDIDWAEIAQERRDNEDGWRDR